MSTTAQAAASPAPPLVLRARGFLLGLSRGAGGLLIRIDDGEAFALNASAALVWRLHLEQRQAPDIAAALAARFAIPLAQARRDVEVALGAPGAAPPASAASAHQAPAPNESEPAGPLPAWTEQRPYVYARTPDGHRLGLPELPLFELEADGAGLTWVGGAPGAPGHPCPPGLTEQALGSARWTALGFEPGAAPPTLEAHLWIVAPRLLALQGFTVLHAAAVRVGDRAALFLGDSGAGKSTTARAFSAAGCPRLADDKLVLAADGRGLVQVEPVLRRWCQASAEHIRAGQHRVSAPRADGLDLANAAPIATLYFVARGQRRPGAATLDAQPLDEGSALAWAFQQGFLGSFDPDEWERRLRAVTSLCAVADCWRLVVPDGVEALAMAVRDHVDGAVG